MSTPPPHDRSSLLWRAGPGRVATGVLLALLLTVLLALAGGPVGASESRSGQGGFAAECGPPPLDGESVDVVVGEVACQRIDSEALGAPAPFSYYVPSACADGGCPALYLMSGTAGSYRSYLGSTGNTSTVAVRALSSGPPVDPREHPQPWQYASPATWEPRPKLEMILVVPHNQTVPGGNGPEPGMDGLWSDWNPRYAAGGDSEQYSTPPPRFATHVTEEVIPFVEEHLGAVPGRQHRAIHGISQGGFGALKFGLAFPDLFATTGSVSGGSHLTGHVGHFPDSPLGTAPPVPAPHVPVPGVVPLASGSTGEPFTSAILGGMLLGWGDPAADAPRWRANNPASLVTNARAHAGQEQSVQVYLTSNDAVPRRTEDVENERYPYDQGYELATFYGTMETVRALEAAEVDYRFDLNPGLHSGTYFHPFTRLLYEAHYAKLRQRDGGGDPPPRPRVFDYRTIDTSFDIWGWSFAVQREATEFLNLRAVTCDELTLQGTGQVTVTVPARCQTGRAGTRSFTVDLGHSHPTDELYGGTQLPAYGTTVTIQLEPLRHCPPERAHGAGPCPPR